MEKESGYETFDSGAGPLISEGDSKNYADRDSNLTADGVEGQDKDKGIPYSPMK